MLAQAASLGSLRGALTRSFRQFLTNRRERTSSSNLYQRTTKILRSGSPFVAVGSSTKSGEQLWTVGAEDGSHSEDRSSKSLRELVQVAFELDDAELELIHYRQNSLKSSPILRNPKLRQFHGNSADLITEILIAASLKLPPRKIIKPFGELRAAADP